MNYLHQRWHLPDSVHYLVGWLDEKRTRTPRCSPARTPPILLWNPFPRRKPSGRVKISTSPWQPHNASGAIDNKVFRVARRTTGIAPSIPRSPRKSTPPCWWTNPPHSPEDYRNNPLKRSNYPERLVRAVGLSLSRTSNPLWKLCHWQHRLRPVPNTESENYKSTDTVIHGHGFIRLCEIKNLIARFAVRFSRSKVVYTRVQSGSSNFLLEFLKFLKFQRRIIDTDENFCHFCHSPVIHWNKMAQKIQGQISF